MLCAKKRMEMEEQKILAIGASFELLIYVSKDCLLWVIFAQDNPASRIMYENSLILSLC